jgi:hypothetical protein
MDKAGDRFRQINAQIVQLSDGTANNLPQN